MRKSIGALLGVVAVLSACGTPTMMTAPSTIGSSAASARSDQDVVDRLFETLRAHFQVEGSSVMSLSPFRLYRSRHPQLDEATAAIRQYVTKMGTPIDRLIISTNPTGHDKFAYLAIGKKPNAPDKVTMFHAGTYAVGSKTINGISNFGTSLVQ